MLCWMDGMLDEGMKGVHIDDSDEFVRRCKGSFRSDAKDND